MKKISSGKIFEKFSLRLVALVTVVSLSLSGCIPSGQNGPTPTPSNGKVTLIWWNLFEPEANVKPLIDAFEAQNPNITIQYAQKGKTDGVEGYLNSLDGVLNDQDPLNAPDIFTIPNNSEAKYDKYISKAPTGMFSESDLNDFYPIVKQDFAQNGVAALPIYLDAIAVIYNKDMLLSAGYTVPDQNWTQFQTQARKLTQRDSQKKITVAGFSANNPSNTEFNFELINLLFLQNGVTMTDVTGQKAVFASQPESDSAYSFYQDFTAGGGQATWAEYFKKDIAAFLEKKLVMYAAPSWRLIDILNYNKQYNLGLNVGVGKMPQLAGSDAIYWPSYWGQTVSKDSQHKQEAWKFIQFITSTDQLKTLDSTVKSNGRPIGIIFPRQSMNTELANDQYLGPYVQSLAKAKNWNMKDAIAMKKAFNDSFLTKASLKEIETKATTILQNTR